MGNEAVARFLKFLGEDPSAAAELAALGAGEDHTVDLNDLVEMAHSHGYTLTADELEEGLAAATGRLTDEDLEQVAGGLKGATKFPSYSLIRREDGSTSIRFGDGIRGSRPSSGGGTTSATYRTGGGSSGKTG